MSGKNKKAIRIQFLGQCIALGGSGVELPSAYPNLIKPLLEAEFPGVSFQIGLKQLAHPLGLKPLARASLLLFRPDVMIISLPGVFVSAPRPVNLVEMIAPELLFTARSFLLKMRSRIRSDATLWKLYHKSPTLLPRAVYPPLAVESYLRSVEDALRYCQEADNCRVVLMGPGGFNEDAKDDWLPTPGAYNAVNEMVVQMGQQFGLPVINATEIMAAHDGAVYQPNSSLWSECGHSVMAREIGYVIADQIRVINGSSNDRRRAIAVDVQ
jgi:hypothetical protein